MKRRKSGGTMYGGCRVTPTVGLCKMINVGRKKVAITAVALVARILDPTLGVYARDYGQYEDVPQHIRDWFKALKNPQTGGNCCDQSDCARTEARTHGNEWEARVPNGCCRR